jgi:hypothetical protein
MSMSGCCRVGWQSCLSWVVVACCFLLFAGSVVFYVVGSILCGYLFKFVLCLLFFGGCAWPRLKPSAATRLFAVFVFRLPGDSPTTAARRHVLFCVLCVSEQKLIFHVVKALGFVAGLGWSNS